MCTDGSWKYCMMAAGNLMATADWRVCCYA